MNTAIIKRNVWGTDKALIDANEYCVDCERKVPFHYTNCVHYPYIVNENGIRIGRKNTER